MELSGPLALALILQVVGVTLAFSLAARRSQRTSRVTPTLRSTRSPSSALDDAAAASGAPDAAAGRVAPARPVRGSHEQAGPSAAEDGHLDGLYAQRRQLQQQLAADRADQAASLSAYTERRREILVDLQALRRELSDRSTEERELTSRVEALTLEVQHLEQRRGALLVELKASTTSSQTLAERAGIARQRLAALKLEHERFVMRRRREAARLEDLARRSELLKAENDELSSLLEVLQQLTGAPTSLTLLSDGSDASEIIAGAPTDQPASSASAARRPDTIAPWMEPVSTWSPANQT
jgi:hypothetical protein